MTCAGGSSFCSQFWMGKCVPIALVWLGQNSDGRKTLRGKDSTQIAGSLRSVVRCKAMSPMDQRRNET